MHHSIRFSVLVLSSLIFFCFSDLRAQKKAKTATPLSSLTVFSTGNQFIWADVEGTNGRINVLLPPGRNFDPSLNFPDHSYFTCAIGRTYFTNNDRISLPVNAQMLQDGNTIKIGDTIRTTWTNKSGADIIQDIYPSAFTKSGQIVYKWKVKNNGNVLVSAACQFLNDIQITDQTDPSPMRSNDGPIVLTKWGYHPVWQQYPNGSQYVPPFFVGFLHDLPYAPQYTPNLSGLGYFDYPSPPLNLIKPFRVTIGDWYTMAGTIFGANPQWPVNTGSAYGSPTGSDNAVLTEFATVSVPPGQTVEVGRTSYGTGEYERCLGQLFSLVFYPHHIVWDSASQSYSPNPIHIEKFLVNGPSSSSASDVKLTLNVDNNLLVVDSVCSKPIGKSQTIPASGSGRFLAPGDVAYYDWWACASPALFCTGPVSDTFRFTATSTLGPPTFVNPLGADECDQLITLDCAESDVNPPIITDSVYSCDMVKVTVADSRTSDKGLQSLSWTVASGTDSSKFLFTVGAPAITPCYNDKLDHVVTITRASNDSTVGGCFDFTATDCLGHQSYRSVCLKPCYVPAHPDSLPPVFNFVLASGSRDSSPCSRHIDSFEVRDNRSLDSGLCSVDTISGSVNNMRLSIPKYNTGDPIVRFTVSVNDTLKDGYLTVRAIDCSRATHTTDTAFYYCAPVQGGVARGSASGLKLEANQPNPFSQFTTFAYTTADYGVVKLILYDELGKEIAQIFDEVKPQGSYSTRFDGSKLPSGGYIVRLENAGMVASRKIIVQH